MAKIGFSVGSMLREKKDPNKEVPVYLTVHVDAVRVVRQYIPFTVKPKDYSKGEIIGDPDLNDLLQDYKQALRKWMLKYNGKNGYYPSPEEIILYLKNVFSGKHKEAPEFKNDYKNIFLKDNTVRKSSKRGRKSLLSNLEKYCEHTNQILTYSSIQNGFIKGFIKYLREERNLRESSIETRLRTLKAFMREASIQDRHNIDVNKFPKFVPSTNIDEDRQKEDELRYITIDHEDMLKIKGLELPGRLAETRDIALILYTYALRVSDARKINTGNLNKQKTHFLYTQTKTSKGKPREKGMKVPVKNKFLPEILELLDKYGGSPPDLALVDLNTDLRIIGAMINKKYVKIASHSFRRSRITNMLDEGISRESIIILSGHSDFSSLELYVKKESKTFRNQMEDAI